MFRININKRALFVAALVYAVTVAHFAGHVIGDKRMRPEDVVAPKRACNDQDRATRRMFVAPEIMALPEAFFSRMFRMRKVCARLWSPPYGLTMPPQKDFVWLVIQITPYLRQNWSERSYVAARMATEVSPILQLAATIRWLSGGSIYDIAFAFKTSHKTIEAYKYNVIAAINAVLKGKCLLLHHVSCFDSISINLHGCRRQHLFSNGRRVAICHRSRICQSDSFGSQRCGCS